MEKLLKAIHSVGHSRLYTENGEATVGSTLRKERLK
jgi:hypothetical protein